MPFNDMQNELDAWILLILQKTIKEVNNELERYNIPKAAKALKDFLPHLSKWYIRRSRERFADGEEVVLEVLYYVLVEYVKLAAPFTPFISEYIYGVLVKEQFPSLPESVHLCDYPVFDSKYVQEHTKIEDEMELVRELSEAGQMIRASKGIKVRQPLSRMMVALKEPSMYLTEWMKMVLREELNVLEVEEAPKVEGSSTIEVVDNRLFLAGLDIEINEELARQGLYREIVRTIQAARKKMGLAMGEEVKVTYSTESEEIRKILEEDNERIRTAVSASSLKQGDADSEHKVNEHILKLKLDSI
jgi:isoleucyl-tRNA synthetase